jgi:hypothetical protein
VLDDDTNHSQICLMMVAAQGMRAITTRYSLEWLRPSISPYPQCACRLATEGLSCRRCASPSFRTPDVVLSGLSSDILWPLAFLPSISIKSRHCQLYSSGIAQLRQQFQGAPLDFMFASDMCCVWSDMRKDHQFGFQPDQSSDKFFCAEIKIQVE